MKCYAYTDESGNSGLKLFDVDQDAFWTGTLVAFADVDTKYRSFHKELLAAVGKEELHGSKLGFKGINTIAARLSWFIREKKLHFSFARVHKPFLAASKLFDLAFDSGANPAMPPHAYGVRQLRLLNAMHFVQLLTLDDLKEFWSLFAEQDAVRFSALLRTLAERAKASPFDTRSVQILSDVLSWGSEHPERILDPFSEGDSPNFVAFCSLFDHLHKFHEQNGHVIGSFIHDEQNQFVPSFREAFDYLSKFQGDDRPMSLISDIKLMPTFDCSLVVRSSSESFGLQIVDICMWLVKRVIDQGDKPRDNCLTLFKSLFERSWISRFDFSNIVSQVRSGADFVEALPLTEEQLARGRAVLGEFERSRVERMNAAS
jgi:hypothetical protein